MCLLLTAYQADPTWPLVILDNRDEFYVRPTAALASWPGAPDVLAGRDLQSGGSWLGVRRDGRWAAVTNYREPRNDEHAEKSRGWLVRDFLLGAWTANAYIDKIVAQAEAFAGFNLLVGDPHSLWFYSNRDPEARQLSSGIYGLSNGRLDAPWPKVRRGKQKLKELLARPTWQPEEALELMRDPVRAADADLPATGVPLDWERALSSMFIRTPTYGTRSTTLLAIDRRGSALIIERTYDETSQAWQDVRFDLASFS